MPGVVLISNRLFKYLFTTKPTLKANFGGEVIEITWSAGNKNFSECFTFSLEKPVPK
jgi:hypothetical protein